MSLLIGTTAGAFRLGDTAEEVLGGTRINHVTYADGSWWMVDGKGRIHRDGEVLDTMPDGATPLCIQPTPETIWIGADKARLFGIDHGVLSEDEFFASAPGRDN